MVKLSNSDAALTLEQRLEVALREYDETMKTAVAELVKRGDKDFYWEERVADFVEVAKDLRRRHRRLIGG